MGRITMLASHASIYLFLVIGISLNESTAVGEMTMKLGRDAAVDGPSIDLISGFGDYQCDLGHLKCRPPPARCFGGRKGDGAWRPLSSHIGSLISCRQ